MKVVVTQAAFDDLLRIGAYIRRHNPARARTFIDEIEDRCLRLGATPFAFPLMPNHEHSGIRRRPYGDYLIFYRVGEEAVEILHALHGARDIEAILFPEE
jgi:plasmid stabilization system protein ParE